METSSKDKSSERSWAERLVKLAPTILALVTAAFFLNGRAFRMGYLGHFNLNTTMFDDDISSLVTISVRAWLEVIVHLLVRIAPHSVIGWMVVALVLVVPIVLGWGVRCWARCTITSRRKRRRQIKKVWWERIFSVLNQVFGYIRRNIFLRRPPRWLSFLRRLVWGVGFLGYFANLALALVALIMLSLVMPFERVGSEVAASDQAKHFADEPSVTLKGPDGLVTSYKVILCASRFCALYSDAAIVTVPVSALTWGVSRAKEESPGNASVSSPEKPPSAKADSPSTHGGR